MNVLSMYKPLWIINKTLHVLWTVSPALSAVVHHHHGDRRPEPGRRPRAQEVAVGRPPHDFQLAAGLDPGPGSGAHLVLCLRHHVRPGGLQDRVRWGGVTHYYMYLYI